MYPAPPAPKGGEGMEQCPMCGAEVEDMEKHKMEVHPEHGGDDEAEG